MCLSVCPSVLYLLLDHWMDRNETLRGLRHQPLDGYYILKTYCYHVNFRAIFEEEKKHESRLKLIAHILIWHRRHRDLPPTSLSISYLPSTSYLLPPTFLSISYLPLLSLTSYLLFYLLPLLLSPFLPLASYLPFYLLSLFLPPTFLSTCRDHNYVICGGGRYMWKSNHVAWKHVVGNREMGEEKQVFRLIGRTEARSKQ